MSQHPPEDYFERRAEEERAASECATDERAAQSHRELAKRYRSRARHGEPALADEPLTRGILSRKLRIVS